MRASLSPLVLVLALTAAAGVLAAPRPGPYPLTEWVDYAGYTDCLKLGNGACSVIIGPHTGGRLLGYSWQGKGVIPLNPAQDGYTWQPGAKTVDPYGGRLDVGPELSFPRHTDLWLGPWRGRFTGPGEACLVSLVDSNTGVQLIRHFRLEAGGSHLRCTQKIINRGNVVRRCCHWSRSFALGNGICVVPLNPHSRFPRGYLTYGPGSVMDYAPRPGETVRVRDGCLEIRGTPPFSKFMVDPVGPREEGSGASAVSRAWLAYLTPNEVLWVKRFPVYERRAYGEACAASLSLYYYPFTEDRAKAPEQRSLPIDFCELEPIGPMEVLGPGEAASYSEDWYLLPMAFPKEGENLDLIGLGKTVLEQTR